EVQRQTRRAAFSRVTDCLHRNRRRARRGRRRSLSYARGAIRDRPRQRRESIDREDPDRRTRFFRRDTGAAPRRVVVLINTFPLSDTAETSAPSPRRIEQAACRLGAQKSAGKDNRHSTWTQRVTFYRLWGLAGLWYRSTPYDCRTLPKLRPLLLDVSNKRPVVLEPKTWPGKTIGHRHGLRGRHSIVCGAFLGEIQVMP
ncbi:hypothetical protein ACHAWF_001515, partial [Thalassiosira exigua]